MSSWTVAYRNKFKGKPQTLTNSVSSPPWFPSATPGSCCGTVLSEGFFFPDFFFFLAFDCTDAPGATASWDSEGFPSWDSCLLPREEACGVSVISMGSTGVEEGIWKLKAKVEPCPVKDIRLGAVSGLSVGRLSGRKLNLKLLSLWDQSGLSALPVRGAEPFDLGSISVGAKSTKYMGITYFLHLIIRIRNTITIDICDELTNKWQPTYEDQRSIGHACRSFSSENRQLDWTIHLYALGFRTWAV